MALNRLKESGRSMDYNLLVSREAETDIDNIARYIAVQLQNRDAAVGFLDDVENAYSRLIKQPRLYNFCDNARLREKGYRKVILKNYIMIYRVSEETDSVIILRVFYGRMDYLNIL